MMRPTLSRALPILAFLALAGCLTHVPANPNSRHLHIRWVEDFDTARGLSAEARQPILLVMVAGEIRELC